MGEVWDEKTGVLNPSCRDDIDKGFQKLLDDRVLSLYLEGKRSKGAIRKFFHAIFDLAPSIEELVNATERAINKKAGFKYVLGAFANNQGGEVLPEDEPPEGDPMDDPPPGGPGGHGKAKPRYASVKPAAVKAEQKVTPDSDDSRTGKNYILLYRYLRTHPFFVGKDPIARLIFIDLILDASYSNHQTEWRGIKINLKRGQWVVSYREMAAFYRVNEISIRRWLKDMKAQGMVDLEVVTMKSNFSVAPTVAPPVAPPVARQDKFGVLVTICNYEKWQPSCGVKVNSNVAPPVAPGVAGGDALQKEGITKEGNTEEGKYSRIFPEITSTQILEIWEKEKGVLPQVRAPEPKKLGDLTEYLNSLVGKDPVAAWTEIIHKARQCHQSNRVYMSPVFFSKDLSHIDQVMNGLYERSFERGKYGSTRVEREGRGDAEDFGFTGGRRRRVTVV